MSVSTGSRTDRIDTSQASELVALGAAVVVAVIIGAVYLGQQVAQIMLAIGAGLRV